MKKTTIMVAPLNWGLGHATRCIPIINALTQSGARVIVASDGVALVLLREVFPDLPSVELPGYNISYQKKGSFAWHLLRQVPSVLKTIKSEHEALQHYVETLEVDAVISDNRFGMWHTRIPSVFITHQLFTRLHGPLACIAPLLHWFNHRMIRKFNEVWVPDVAGSQNLSGKLSHQPVGRLKVRYIGWLSHFSSLPLTPEPEIRYDVAAILSGPEPQRTLLEEKLLPQLEASGKRCLLVRGLPGAAPLVENRSVEVVNYLPAKELSQVMLASQVIVCRSGYTTVMDLAWLQRKAIMIPTPGQAEQEYLAQWLEQQGYCAAACQQTFNLNNELQRVGQFGGIPAPSQEPITEQLAAELIKRAAR